MLSPITIVLIALASIVFLFLLVETFVRKSGSKTILQSEVVKLEADKSYTVIFRKTPYSSLTSFTIKARPEHLNLATKNTYYNGRVEVYIQVSTAGITVYSAYLKNVIDFFPDEDATYAS